MKKDPKIVKNREFISKFEELGFLYQESKGFLWMRKQDGSANKNVVYFHATKYGQKLYLSYGKYLCQREGFHLENFQSELADIIKSIDTIYDELKVNRKIGFFNKKIMLDKEIIYISNHSSFSVERGFIPFSIYE